MKGKNVGGGGFITYGTREQVLCVVNRCRMVVKSKNVTSSVLLLYDAIWRRDWTIRKVS